MRNSLAVYSEWGLITVRAAILGNGRLCLSWDEDMHLTELFWPRVGLMNHIQENRRNGIVLWHSGRLHYVGSGSFRAVGKYSGGMGFEWNAQDQGTGARVLVKDWIDPWEPVWARHIRVFLPPGIDRGAVCMVHSLALGENTVGEGAAHDPLRGRLYHFKGRCWVAVRFSERPAREWGRSFSPARRMAAVAKVRDGGIRFSEDDGSILGSNADHGLIESAVGIAWAGSSVLETEYMLAFGRDRTEADARLDAAGDADRVAERSRKQWAGAAGPAAVSLKVLSSHCDYGGGVVASCDSDIMGDFRDHYRYVWPRDAAMCVSSLARAGYPDYARRYLLFCSRALSREPLFFQRYRTDGSRGSGWHPWDLPPGQLPVQEDETALSLVSARDYFDATGDSNTLRRVYETFIRRAARGILEYTTCKGTLVRPSYDLWEERRGVFSFTQASCLAGLSAASQLSHTLGEENDSREFSEGARRLLYGLVSRLSDDDRGYCRGILSGGPEVVSGEMDWTPDASLFLVPLLLPEARVGSAATDDDEGRREQDALQAAWRRATVTWKVMKDALSVRLAGWDVPGFARYRGDWYFRPHGAGDAPGNPWPVATAWYVLAGVKLGLLDVGEIHRYAEWFGQVATANGLLPEQVSCVTGQPLSVTPLAWSHAAHLDVLAAAGLLHTGAYAREG